MRFCWIVTISDYKSQLLCCSVRNSRLCAAFGLWQLLVAAASVAQHVHSLTTYGHIFLCQANVSASANFSQKFLAYDIIIYDYGLFLEVLGTPECIANYLDGGYMRFMWCAAHMASLLTLFVVLCGCERRPWLLAPALLYQSIYALGLAILTMAASPKALHVFNSHHDNSIYVRVGIFLLGEYVNWLFTFVLWHYYWFLDESAKQRSIGVRSLSTL